MEVSELMLMSIDASGIPICDTAYPTKTTLGRLETTAF
jgi:hypothetical protein